MSEDFRMHHAERPMRQFMRDELVKSAVRFSILGIIAILTYVATPIGSRVVSIWNSPIVLEQILFELASNRRVVDYSPASRFTQDCKRGESCLVVLRYRRVDGAGECRIIQEATRFTLMSYNDFIPRGAINLDAKGYNVGTNFETRELRLLIPRNIPLGAGELRVSSSYQDCAWQIGDEPPTSAISPSIEFNITE